MHSIINNEKDKLDHYTRWKYDARQEEDQEEGDTRHDKNTYTKLILKSPFDNQQGKKTRDISADAKIMRYAELESGTEEHEARISVHHQPLKLHSIVNEENET